jgi:hypothetical protein
VEWIRLPCLGDNSVVEERVACAVLVNLLRERTICHIPMPYLIDGHNLIPNLTSSRRFRRRATHRTAYSILPPIRPWSGGNIFDNAPVRPDSAKGADAYFVRKSLIADQVFLTAPAPGRAGVRNWSVVSSTISSAMPGRMAQKCFIG